MTTRSSRDRNPRGGEVAGAPMIATLRASYAAAFTRASEKSRLSSLGASQAPTGPRSLQARTSAAEGGRLRDAFGAARRRPDRCKIQNQELKTEPLPCLINSAGSPTYPTRKSVRTTRATPRCPDVSPSCIGVADIGGEELDEPAGRSLIGGKSAGSDPTAATVTPRLISAAPRRVRRAPLPDRRGA